MPTKENAKEAFAGESQANRRYTIFAEKADAEGYPNVAKLFRAAAEAEAVHAKRLIFLIDEVKGTDENLRASVEGETYEFTEMYPEFLGVAEDEDQTEAVKFFTHARKAEEVHAGLYSKALEAVSGGSDLEAEKIFFCPICGNVVLDAAPDSCPICGVPGRMFREVS
ncbi:MAG: rubrerythrin family protein [Methanoculleaceae archaeon]